MEIQKKYIQLFYDLNLSEKGLLAFTVHSRYNLTPTDVISFISIYKEKGFITCDNEYRIKITEPGRAAILKIQEERKINVPHTKGAEYFVEQQTTNRLAINEPYIPNADFMK